MTTVDKYLELLPEDIKKMTRKELSKVVSTLASAANKRMVRILDLGDIGKLSPAMSHVIQRGAGRKVDVLDLTPEEFETAYERGKFSVKGKDQGQLQAEYKRVKNFLTRRTSSKGGWKEVRREVAERVGGKWKSVQDEKAFWELYRTYENDPRLQSYGSEQAQTMMMTEIRSHGFDVGRDFIEQRLSQAYEESEEVRARDEEARNAQFTVIDNKIE